ncbi:MAG: M23 family metallopeptidase, partial [Sphingomonadales bacterium]|nr:M23 family metallopeptidase [Sphingomonadales bacterium]
MRNDNYGFGHFGAPRTSNSSNRKTHNGTDYLAEADQEVRACISGKVSKIGYPYASDLQYRYVEITNDDGYSVRHFYVFPASDIDVGTKVKQGQAIGQCQNLAKKYRGMKNHVHVEIKKDGELLNPEGLINNYILSPDTLKGNHNL